MNVEIIIDGAGPPGIFVSPSPDQPGKWTVYIDTGAGFEVTRTFGSEDDALAAGTSTAVTSGLPLCRRVDDRWIEVPVDRRLSVTIDGPGWLDLVGGATDSCRQELLRALA